MLLALGATTVKMSPKLRPPSVDRAPTRLTTPMLSDSLQVTVAAAPPAMTAPVDGDTSPAIGAIESGGPWSISKSLAGSAETGRFAPSYAVTLILAWVVGRSGTSQLKLDSDPPSTASRL